MSPHFLFALIFCLQLVSFGKQENKKPGIPLNGCFHVARLNEFFTKNKPEPEPSPDGDDDDDEVKTTTEESSEDGKRKTTQEPDGDDDENYVSKPPSNSSINPKILNGHDAKKNSFPYIVKIYDPLETAYVTNKGIECAGTLIHPRWVLTSEKCLRSIIFRTVFSKRFFVMPKVVPNVNNKRSISKSDPIIDVDLLCNLNTLDSHANIQPSYLVLLKLKKPMPISKTTKTVAVHSKPFKTGSLHIAGWGLNKKSDQPNSEYLRFVSKTLRAAVVNASMDCRRRRPFNSFNSICASGGEVCNGDEGGPIVKKSNKKSKDFLVAIQTNVDSFYACNNAKPFRSYTYLYPFRKEIKDILAVFKDNIE